MVVGSSFNRMLLPIPKLHTSPEGDLLLIDQPITAGLFVSKAGVSAFFSDPARAPHYSFVRPIQIETFRLADELGFTFSPTNIAIAITKPELAARPVLRLVLGGKLHLLLVPAVLMPEEALSLLNADPALGLVVSELLALPRGAASSYAVKLMARSFRRRRPNPEHP